MHNLIKQYIDKLTINNINDFAKKNNCFLNKKELNLLYTIIKNNYQEILKGNDKEILETLKTNISKENYTKIISIYKTYKTKYQNYL